MMQLYYGNRNGVMGSAVQESGWAFLAPLWTGAKWVVGQLAVGVGSFAIYDAITGDSDEEKANSVAEQMDSTSSQSEKDMMGQVMDSSDRAYYANTSGFLTGYGPRAAACGVSPAIQQNIDNAIDEFKTVLLKGDATTFADLYAMRAALALFLQRHCKDPVAEKNGMLPCNPATGFPGDPGWQKLNPGKCKDLTPKKEYAVIPDPFVVPGVPGTTTPSKATLTATPTDPLQALLPIGLIVGGLFAAWLLFGKKG